MSATSVLLTAGALRYWAFITVPFAGVTEVMQRLADGGWLRQTDAPVQRFEQRALVIVETLTPDGIQRQEQFAPIFMGGNYLPELKLGEVEIARITLASTTHDAIAVYARPGEHGGIDYRVVDEYSGDLLQEPNTAHTTQPMSLGQFADFFLNAYTLMDVLQDNYPDDLESALEFFSAESDFYPALDATCRARVEQQFK